MNSNISDLNADKQRQDILDAAHERFITYGIGKTTMAEIAKDTSMSAANLYRYFQNKQDIAAVCADRCMSSRNEHLRAIVRQSHLNAVQRLNAFAIEGYRYNYNTLKNTPKINELVHHVSSENPELIHKNMKAQVAIIAEVLAFGNETSEFEVSNIIHVAENIQSALILFDVPIFIPLFSAEEFETKALGVVDLLVEGIRKR